MRGFSSWWRREIGGLCGPLPLGYTFLRVVISPSVVDGCIPTFRQRSWRTRERPCNREHWSYAGLGSCRCIHCRWSSRWRLRSRFGPSTLQGGFSTTKNRRFSLHRCRCIVFLDFLPRDAVGQLEVGIDLIERCGTRSDTAIAMVGQCLKCLIESSVHDLVSCHAR